MYVCLYVYYAYPVACLASYWNLTQRVGKNLAGYMVGSNILQIHIYSTHEEENVLHNAEGC